MDLVSDPDGFREALEVDVQIRHEKFSEPEREKQFAALFHPVAVRNLEGSEGQCLVA